MRSKRNAPLAVGLLALVLASASHAASISIQTDAASYLPGSTITLSVYVTSNAPETSDHAFGAILYDASLVAPGTPIQYLLPPGGWTQGVGPLCTTAHCWAIYQLRPLGAVSVNVTNFLIATLTFTIHGSTPIGTSIPFAWRTAPSSQSLDFFGVTSAPGVTVSTVPEPSAAALVALGLLGLAVARRAAQRTRMVAAARR